MKRNTDSVITDRRVTINYLLGELPEDERLRIERECFSTDEAFEAMLAVEDELFADYVRGVLPPGDRARFETRFLATPEGRRRLGFARALIEALARQAAGRRPARDWLARLGLNAFMRPVALAAAVLALAIGTAWLARDVARWRSEAADEVRHARADLDAERARRGQVERDLAAARAAHATPLVVSVLLSPGLTRGSGETARIALPAAADVLRLQLDARRVSPGSYRARLRTAEGDTIWSGPIARRPNVDVIEVDVPAPLLATHDYELAVDDLSGSPAVSYVVTVVRH